MAETDAACAAYDAGWADGERWAREFAQGDELAGLADIVTTTRFGDGHTLCAFVDPSGQTSAVTLDLGGGSPWTRLPRQRKGDQPDHRHPVTRPTPPGCARLTTMMPPWGDQVRRAPATLRWPYWSSRLP